MKKYLIYVITLIVLLFPKIAYAAGGMSVSTGSLTIEVGSSKTFTISATNTIGDASISSGNSTIASVSTGFWETGMVDEGKTKSGTITVNGRNIGTTNIHVVFDGATFDGETVGYSRDITVTVIAAPTPPTPDPTPTPTPSGGGNNNNNKQEEKKSNNAKLKSIRIDDHSLVKIDDNNYILTVNTDVTSININAEAQDSKAIVNGLGLFELHDGENPFEITITAEDGTTRNVIKIVVTRKEEEKKEEDIKPVEPEKKEQKKEKKKINIGLKDYLLLGSLLLNVLLIVVGAIIYSKYFKLKESTKNMVYDSGDLPFDYRKENEK